MNWKLFIIVALLGLVVSIPFWSRQADIPAGFYPWQIEVHADGSSTVFGLHLGKTSLSEARSMLGEAMKLALLSTDKGDDSVEMYYSHFSAGRLSGRLVIVADLTDESITEMRARAVRSGGAHTFRLHGDDLPEVMRAAIKSLTFIPVVDLDETIIQQRFGQAAEIVGSHETLRHYLYPHKGLDLILDSDGKEVLQYVPPRDFHQLRDPLKQ